MAYRVILDDVFVRNKDKDPSFSAKQFRTEDEHVRVRNVNSLAHWPSFLANDRFPPLCGTSAQSSRRQELSHRDDVGLYLIRVCFTLGANRPRLVGSSGREP